MRGLLRFLAWTAILVGGFIGIARLTAIRWLRLPTDDPVFTASLAPSLWPGDLILTWRLTEPGFGDLVLCPEPNYPDRYVIGRVAGIPGDQVVIEDGKPVVNGRNFVRERNCNPPVVEYPNPDDPSETIHQSCEWESMANKLHMMGSPLGHTITPENREFLVPSDHFFLLSDNRLFPYDSRDYGFVDMATCNEWVIGRLVGAQGWADSEHRFNYIP